MKHLLKTGAALALAATTITFTASAADAESTWKLGDNNGNAFLYMADASGPSLTLNCSERMGVQAVLYLDGNSIDELTIDGSRRITSRKVTMESESTEARDGDWAYLRKAKTLISTRGWQGKRIFNAAVTGSPVSIDIRRVGTVNVTPPEVNDEFREFVESCSAI